MEFETVWCEIDAGLARVTLARPAERNGITNKMVKETRLALQAVADDKSVRVVVMTGAGSAFCVGADLNQLVLSDDRGGPSADDFAIPAILHAMPAVTVAAINGACAGAGLGWALACDLRVMAASAKLNTAFLDVGLAGDMAIPWSLPRLIGTGRARDWSFRPRRMTSEDALGVGLVSEVFADQQFPGRTQEFLDALLTKAPGALRMMKQNYLLAEELPLSPFVELEARRHLERMDDPEVDEACCAFLEKRPPRFAGG